MKSYLSALGDFFLPRFCMGCDEKLTVYQNVLCHACYEYLKTPDETIIHSEYDRKFRDSKNIDGFTSAFVFEKDSVLQKIIHSLKYENKSRLGKYLGEQIYFLRGAEIIEWNIDFIIPVPLFHLKKAERGYNQSYYVAHGLARSMRLKIGAGILKRKRFTPSQTKLNLEERKANVSEAFTLKEKRIIKSKNILLIDDVITTGATIEACAKVLKMSGVGKVYAASVAIADPLHSLGSA